MHTIRFKGYHSIYFVYYKNIIVSVLKKVNKNKWHLTFINPFFNYSEETFNSLKEAKRFIRVYLNRRYLADRYIRKTIELGATRVIEAIDKFKNQGAKKNDKPASKKEKSCP